MVCDLGAKCADTGSSRGGLAEDHFIGDDRFRIIRSGDVPVPGGIQTGMFLPGDHPRRGESGCRYRAGAELAFELERGAVELHQGLGQGKPEAGALVRAMQAAIDLAELLQCCFDIFGGYTDASVVDRQ